MECNRIIFNNFDLPKGLHECICSYFFRRLVAFKINPDDKDYEFSVNWRHLNENLYITTAYYKYKKNDKLVEMYTGHIGVYTDAQLKYDYPDSF